VVRLSGEWRLLPLLQAEASRDERLSAIAAHVLAGQRDLFRFGQLKAGSHERAVAELAGWSRRNGLEPSFEVRKVRGVDVVFVVLKQRTT
jgi:hypothetical protein